MLDTIKTALVFPGVGSQHTSMCKNFYDNFQIIKDVYNEASDVLHMDMESICFLKEYKDDLYITENAQLALLTASIAIFKLFEQEINFKPNFLLGHSLGEYSALCASGAISFSQALELVKKRGEIIKEVSAKVNGTMSWIINTDYETVVSACKDVSVENNAVYISAYDCPTQCSISGNIEAVLRASKLLEQKGAIVYPLKMLGPYHSPLMLEASLRIREVLADYEYSDLRYTVIANQNARPYEGKNCIIDYLSKQIISPVKWYESIEYIYGENVKTILEIGPKDLLNFLIKKSGYHFNIISFNQSDKIELIKNNVLIKDQDRLQIIGNCLKMAISVKNLNPSYNEDKNKYVSEIVIPYKKIEALYEKLVEDEETANNDQIWDAIDMAKEVLKKKAIPKDIYQHKINKILDGRVFPNPI